MDETLNDFVKMCMISSNRMMTLIQSILDLSRLQSGKMPLQLAATPIREIAESSMELVSE